jgi:hypothetical protein
MAKLSQLVRAAQSQRLAVLPLQYSAYANPYAQRMARMKGMRGLPGGAVLREHAAA